MDRKYSLTKLSAGDYLLPSNDAKTLWRLVRYTDGPASGLDPNDFPVDRSFWAAYKLRQPLADDIFPLDPDDWDRWEHVSGLLPTRQDAIAEALRLA